MFSETSQQGKDAMPSTRTLVLMTLSATTVIAILFVVPLSKLPLLSIALGITALGWVAWQRLIRHEQPNRQEVRQQLKDIDVMIAYGQTERARRLLTRLQQRYPQDSAISQRLSLI